MKLDNVKEEYDIKRLDWFEQLSVIGGIYSFVAGIFSILIGYFAQFDYLTTVVKNLFLERSSDEKFFQKFLSMPEKDDLFSNLNEKESKSRSTKQESNDGNIGRDTM